MKSDQGIVGVPTGLTDLDEKLGGLHKSDLVTLREDHQWVKRFGNKYCLSCSKKYPS